MTTLPITLVGGTGLTGSATLLALLQSPSAVNLTAITRRDHPSPVQNYTNASTSYVNRALPNLADAITSTEGVGPNGGVYISCLGTTRGQAGGFEKQKEIDLYLNRDLVTKAKADGAKTAILVSSGGANPNSMMGYPQIKGELEEDFKKLDFDHCVILRPGLLMGSREDFRGPEWITQKLFGGMRSIGLPMKHLMTDGEDVGRCIAYLAVNPPTEKVVTLGNAQILERAQKYKESGGKA